MKREWLERRRNGIGSSDTPVLMLGDVYGRRPIDIYLDKIKGSNDKPGNANFRRGHTYEPLCADLYTASTGISVLTPEDDHQRYTEFQVFLKDLPMLADYDGFCEDYWVFEGKAPSAYNFDRIVNEGMDDLYQWQAHHLAYVATHAESLPVGDWRGKVKGTRVVFYGPDSVEVKVYEVPYDPDKAEEVKARCLEFWTSHIVKNVPPLEIWKEPRRLPPSSPKYKPVKGDAWDRAISDLEFAKALSKAAKEREDAVKSRIALMLETEGVDKVIVGGVKLSNSWQDGRRTFDVKAFEASHPELNLEPFYKQGEPFTVFRNYGLSGLEFSFGESSEGYERDLSIWPPMGVDPETAVRNGRRILEASEVYVEFLDKEREKTTRARALLEGKLPSLK